MSAMKFADFDAVLLDMDGTLYLEGHGLPGAAELIAALRAAEVVTQCVTNNGANTSEQLAARLHRMGVDLPVDAIYTAAHAMAAFILDLPEPRRVFNFSGIALPEVLAGQVTFVERVDEPCDVVAVGTHMRENDIPFDFDRSLVGLTHLRNGATLVVGCADRVFPVAGGGVEFGSGSWGQLFAFGGNLPPGRMHHTGKPEPRFFLPLCARLGVDPRRCLMVGDNLESDIAGGQACGMTTALLLTGVTRESDIATSRVQPDYVFAGLPEIVAAWG